MHDYKVVPGMAPSLISDRMLDSPSVYLVYAWESKGEFGIRSQVT